MLSIPELSPTTRRLRTPTADNEYMVTITATANGESDTQDVTVRVTDVEDDTSQPTTLLERYDADQSGEIQKHEAIVAMNDYAAAALAPTR